MSNQSFNIVLPDQEESSTPFPDYQDDLSAPGGVVYPEAAVILALSCSIIFLIFGIIGNSLTIFVLTTNSSLRAATTTTFIISLCCTDLIFCTFNLPILAVRYGFQKWVLGSTLCRLFPFFFYLNVAASLFNMMAVTMNRFFMVVLNRFYARLFTRVNVGVMIGMCWGVPLALLTPTLVGVWGRFGYKSHTFSCTILKKNGASPKKALFVFGFLLPCLIILGSYTAILVTVRRSRKAMLNHSGAAGAGTNGTPNAGSGKAKKHVTSPGQSRSGESTLTLMVVAVFCAFLLCYLPLMLANVLDDEETVPWVHVIASILAWSASIWNPLLYAALNRRYRKAYASALARFCPTCLAWKSHMITSMTSSRDITATSTSAVYMKSANGNSAGTAAIQSQSTTDGILQKSSNGKNGFNMEGSGHQVRMPLLRSTSPPASSCVLLAHSAVAEKLEPMDDGKAREDTAADSANGERKVVVGSNPIENQLMTNEGLIV